MMKFRLLPLITYLCLLSLLMALGFWQLDRAEEKRTALMLQESAQKAESIILNEYAGNKYQSIIYRSVRALGRYDAAHQFLLDNQINRGKAGYFVFTPFLLKDRKQAVLVNRGWLPTGYDRRLLPDIHVDPDETMVAGKANQFPGVGIKLQGAENPNKSWPSLIQVVDINVISKILGYELMPFQIQLDVSEKDGYIREWRSQSPMPPEKHIAYAIQWFLLAVTLTILFIKYGRRKSHD